MTEKTTFREHIVPGPGVCPQRIVFLHELGHWLGLVHPGQKLEPGNRPARDSPADYEADYDSLMGRGMELREDDYNSIFCNHLTW